MCLGGFGLQGKGRTRSQSDRMPVQWSALLLAALLATWATQACGHWPQSRSPGPLAARAPGPSAQ